MIRLLLAGIVCSETLLRIKHPPHIFFQVVIAGIAKSVLRTFWNSRILLNIANSPDQVMVEEVTYKLYFISRIINTIILILARQQL